MSDIEIGQLEALYKKYCEWAHGQGLYPEFGVEFFDWMANAG